MDKSEKDSISVYLPLKFIDIIDKRADRNCLTRSKQIYIDLLDYYKRIKYIKKEDMK